MCRALLIFAFFSVILSLASTVHASSLSKHLGIDINPTKTPEPPMPPPINAPLDPIVLEASTAALVAYYEDYGRSLASIEEARAQMRRTIEWQLFSTRVVFFLVVSIVVSGVLFCWIQFSLSRGRIDTANHNVELSSSGLKLSSPVLGVVVLALSLAFFYCYLHFVYPIRILDVDSKVATPAHPSNSVAPKS